MLRKMLRAYRRVNDIPMRTMAKTIGVSLGTLWRFENNQPLTQTNWSKIMVWLIQGE